MKKSAGYTKFWSQDSRLYRPPYHIDCINPLKVSEATIPRLIITEGEKDVLTLNEAGYPYAISVPNGAASDLSKSFEPWMDKNGDIRRSAEIRPTGENPSEASHRLLRSTPPAHHAARACKDISHANSRHLRH